MKCLSLIINESSKNEMVEFLRSLPEVSAYTIFHGEGHYSGNLRPFESARDEVMGYVPRIRIDLLLEADAVDAVVDRIKHCSACASRRGIYWVSPVSAMGEI